MKVIDKIQEIYIKYFQYILYATIFSIFLVDIKLYIPLFVLNTLVVISMICTKKIKLKLSLWQSAVIVFMVWSIINTAIAVLVYKFSANIGTLIKLNVNMSFLLAISLVLKQIKVNFDKDKFINFMEFMIIINFIQILIIYIFGGLLGDFINGTLTQSSDTAYAISAFSNFIGAESKNIWSGKFMLFFMAYMYMAANESFKFNTKRVIIYILMGLSVLFLLLSRTAQLAVIVPVVFMIFYSLRNIPYKYKVGIYSFLVIAILIVGLIFFNKFFHITFDMTDGGFTRIYIWKVFVDNFTETNWILGNGLGYSGEFIKQVIERKESNLHNVYLNLFFELGIVGIVSYITFLVGYITDLLKNNNIFKILALIIIPFILITVLQYLGFDNDIIMPFALILVINNFQSNELSEVR